MNSALSDDSSPIGEQQALTHPPTGLPAADGSVTSLTLPHAQASPAPSPVLPNSTAAEPQANDRTVISQRPVAAPAPEFMRSLSLVELARTLEGRHLDHFSVDRMIGGGGMGAVFCGRDLRLDREVAIKVIPESRRDPETLRRFRMEAQSAARLDHPNIARVFDIGEDETWNYIVFEFIDGINLRDLVLMNGPMTIDDAVFTTRQVAEALQHAHDRNVVHRDIKPSNVIITPSGVAKVVDMGLARNTAMDRSTADQTASGVTLGTFDYISPEQARDPRDADVRSDLYSLGCTLFYMLTGQPPFPDGTALQKLLNHGSQPAPDPRMWREDISDQLAAVLAKLMAKRPNDRYQKPVELINDLMLIAQLESLPRSGTAGTILISPAIAQRSLLELNLPWLVPLCVLIGSVFWLQSAESFSKPIEVPQPVLKSAQSLPMASAEPIPSLKDPNSSPPATRGLEEPVNVPTLPGSSATPISEKPFTGVAKSLPLNNQSDAERARGLATDVAERGNGEGREPLVRNELVRNENVERNSLNTTERNRVVGAGATSVELGAKPEANSGLANSPAEASTSEEGRAPAPGLPNEANGLNRPPVATPAYSTDVIVISEQPQTGVRWETSLPAALMQVAIYPEIRTIELRESIELTSPVTLPRSGLTLRAAPGAKVEITLTGSDAFGMGWESWFEIDRKSLRCQNLRIHCLNDMRQPQAIFAMRPGGKVELDDCMITMGTSRDAMLGHCILVKDAGKIASTANVPSSSTTASSSTLMPSTSPMPSTLMPSTSAPSIMPMPTSSSTNLESTPLAANTAIAPAATSDEAEPITVSIRNTVVRGALSLLTLKSVCRAEITMDNVCAMLEGRVATIRADDDKGVPPIVRMNLQRSTFASLQGFAAVQAAAATRAPVTLMRTAKLCAFWSPTGGARTSRSTAMADQDLLDKLLLLRGEENAYDQQH